MFQVAGSNVIHLQAVDFWNNNITQGGETFVARWTSRGYPGGTVTTATILGSIAGNGDGYVAETAEEGEFWTDVDGDGGGYDSNTASIAAGFFFLPMLSGSNSDSNGDSNDDSNGGNGSGDHGGGTGTYVADVGGGRYEVTTAAVSGSYWLEIGVVEPGGLWGTYYQDGGVETEG